MRLRNFFFIALFLFAIAASEAIAIDPCNDKADEAMSTLKSWSDLHTWYKNYHHCDDGYVAEGISDFVVVSLAKSWQSLPFLEAEITKNRAFKDFVFSHIDTTTDDNDLRMIVTNAKTKCPENLRSLCTEIETKAQTAPKELREVVK